MAGLRASLDVMGYPKEGRAEGDLAGAASIIIPADTYLAGAQESAARETLVFFAFLACCLMVAFFGVSRLVTRPLRKLGVASASWSATSSTSTSATSARATRWRTWRAASTPWPGS